MAPNKHRLMLHKLGQKLNRAQCTEIGKIHDLPGYFFDDIKMYPPGTTLITALEQRRIICEDDPAIMRKFSRDLKDLDYHAAAKIVDDHLDQQSTTGQRPSSPLARASQETVDGPVSTNDVGNKIFISFSFKNEDAVIKVRNEIEEKLGTGTCWICTTGIQLGDNMNKRIVDAIHQARVILCMTTQEFIDSHECEKEFQLAEDLKKEIIMVHLDGVKRPYTKTNGEPSPIQLETARHIYCKLTGPKKEERFEELVDKLKRYI